jgi:hypothetical protein
VAGRPWSPSSRFETTRSSFYLFVDGVGALELAGLLEVLRPAGGTGGSGASRPIGSASPACVGSDRGSETGPLGGKLQFTGPFGPAGTSRSGPSQALTYGVYV